MRFANIAALLKRKSPDVIIIGEEDLPDDAPARAKAPNNRTVLEDKFLGNWLAMDGPELVREYRFDPSRRWRFDFAIPLRKIAFEIQGGLYAPQTGHRSQVGVEQDYEKLNAAQQQGWKVFQVTSKNISDAAFMQKLVDYVLSLF